MLQRIRTLAVQSANGTNTAEDRAALQQEVASLSEEITRIAKQTTFAGATVLDGAGGKSLIPAQGQANAGKIVFQVGANAGDTLNLNWSQSFKVSGIASIAGMKTADIKSANGFTKAASNNIVFTVETASKAQGVLANIDLIRFWSL